LPVTASDIAKASVTMLDTKIPILLANVYSYTTAITATTIELNIIADPIIILRRKAIVLSFLKRNLPSITPLTNAPTTENGNNTDKNNTNAAISWI